MMVSLWREDGGYLCEARLHAGMRSGLEICALDAGKRSGLGIHSFIKIVVKFVYLIF